MNDSNVSSQSSDDECSVYECKSNDDKRKTKRPLNSRVPRKQIKESQKHHHERSDDQEKSPKDITRSEINHTVIALRHLPACHHPNQMIVAHHLKTPVEFQNDIRRVTSRQSVIPLLLEIPSSST